MTIPINAKSKNSNINHCSNCSNQTTKLEAIKGKGSNSRASSKDSDKIISTKVKP